MKLTKGSCIKCVGDPKSCSFCSGRLVRHGLSGSGKLRYKCKDCGKTQVDVYTYQAYHPDVNTWIIHLTKASAGIRSTAKLLSISTTTLLKRIRLIARGVRQPMIIKGKKYEVDEVRTFIGRKKKRIWIAYALERESRQVVSFKVGKRTNKTLKTVLDTLHLSEAKTIYTDKYPAKSAAMLLTCLKIYFWG